MVETNRKTYASKNESLLALNAKRIGILFQRLTLRFSSSHRT